MSDNNFIEKIIVQKIITNLISSEKFFGLLENNSLSPIKFKTTFYKLLCDVLCFDLKMIDIKFVLIKLNNNIVHSYNNNIETTKYNELVNKDLNILYSKNIKEGFIFKKDFPQFLKDKKLIARCIQDENIFIDLWADSSILDINLLKLIIANAIKYIDDIIANYKKIWENICQGSDYDIISNKGWKNNYERDRMLCLTCSIYNTFYENKFDPNELLSSCYFLRYFPKDIDSHGSYVSYLITDFQVKAILQIITKDQNRNFYAQFKKEISTNIIDNAFKEKFPGDSYYTPSAIISGQSILIENWKLDSNIKSDSYPELLEFFESEIIFQEKLYNRYLLPINELGDTRFLIALRLPKEHTPKNYLFGVLENIYLNKAKNFKQIFVNEQIKIRENIIIKGLQNNISEDSFFSTLELLVHNSDNETLSISQRQDIDYEKLELKQKQAYIDTIITQKDNANRAAMKSAVAAIMSRQMSHNIGSHVIPGTKFDIKNGNLGEKDKNGIIRLFHYLQERMDFISMIVNTQEENKLRGCLNLKAHILDELAMDGPGVRHKSKDEERCTNYILRHIVKSENIYRFELLDKFKNFIKSGTNQENHLPIELQIIKKVKSKSSERYRAFTSIGNGDVKSNDFSQIEFSIPYGVNGRHAFLNILEDFIRNTAKHNKKGLELIDKLLFSILIEDKKDISDASIALKDNEYLITIFSNKPSDENELQDIVNAFSKLKLLNKKNAIDQENKGLKEMLICLAWLKDEMTDLSIIENQVINCEGRFKFKELGNSKSLCEYALIENPVKDDSNSINPSLKHLGLRFKLLKYQFVYIIKDKDNLVDENGNPNFPKIFDLAASEIYILENEINFEILSKAIPRIMKMSQVQDKLIISKLNSRSNGHNLSENEKASIYRFYLISIGHKKLPELQVLHNSEKGQEVIEFTKHVKRYRDDIHTVTKSKSDMIIFKQHNDNQSQYQTTFQVLKETGSDHKGLINRIKFMEGISGGNYTYNLVISNVINELEYYRIVDSSLTRIALIDERLFEHFGGKLQKKGNSTIKQVSVRNIIKDLTERIIQNSDKDETVRFLNDHNYKIDDDDIDPLYNIKDLSKLKDAVIKLLNGIDRFNITAEILESKRIQILNLTIKNNKHFLVDLQGNCFDKLLDDFDYISIHFSLIEKYPGGGLIEKFDSFLSEMLGESYQKSKSKIAIHSGRGNLTGLEERATFLPISTIESQLRNCKHLLVQQFANLKYKF